MGTKIKLKPCPFCGGEAGEGTVNFSDEISKDHKLSRNKGYFINCIRCPALMNPLGLGYETPKKAAAAWNKRPEEDTLPIAWLVIRLDGSRELVFSPLTDDAALGDGDVAHALRMVREDT